MFNYQGEKNKEPERPEVQKLCPDMSALVAEANALMDGVELVLKAAPCAKGECGKWLDGECSEVTTARALDSIAGQVYKGLNVNTREDG